VVAEKMLKDIGINDWRYCDNNTNNVYKNKKCIRPEELNTDDFVLVSTIHIQEIKIQLESFGLKEFINWIWVLDRDYYEGIWNNEAAPEIENLKLDDLDKIEDDLRSVVDVIEIEPPNEKKLEKFEKIADYLKIYNKNTNNRYRRKGLEYWHTYNLLNLDKKKSAYIDIGTADCEFASWLRKNTDTEAYAVDLKEGKKILWNTIFVVMRLICHLLTNPLIVCLHSLRSRCLPETVILRL